VLFEMHRYALLVTSILTLAVTGNIYLWFFIICSINRHLGTSIANAVQINTSFNTSGKEIISLDEYFDVTRVGVASLSLSFISNVCATILIAYKFWYLSIPLLTMNGGSHGISYLFQLLCIHRMHRRQTATLKINESRRSIGEQLMKLFVESGALYCCFWVSLPPAR
jgi:hypothetical protein